MFKSSNPIGTVHDIDELEVKLVKYEKIWDRVKPQKSWYPKVDFSKITSFLLFALDEFISTLNNVAIPGPDKKATVLNAIERLYEYTVREVLPIWLMPFAGVIKNYLIYTLASTAIDWIVSKYRDAWMNNKNSSSVETENPEVPETSLESELPETETD